MLHKFGTQTFLQNQKISNLASYLLVGIMGVCIVFVLTAVGEHLQADWQGGYVRWFGVFVILESYAAKFTIDSFDDNKAWLFRLSEWGFLMAGLKFAQLVSVGFQGLPQILVSWQTDPINFFDGEYLLVLLVIGLIWLHSSRYLSLISVLNSYESDLEIYEFVQLRTEREAARLAIVNQFLSVGMLMVILITLARLDLHSLAIFSGSGIALPASISILPLVVYFLCGLVLSSFSRFAILRGAWLVGRRTIQTDIAKIWVKYAFIFFGLVSVAVILLPTSFTHNFLQTSAIVFQFMAEVILFILGFLIFPFMWVYSLILSLLPSGEAATAEAELPQFNLPENIPPASGLPLWFEVLRNVVFWVILTGSITLLVRYYLRQNKKLLSTFSFSRVLSWFKEGWSGFLNWVWGLGEQVKHALTVEASDQSPPQTEKNVIRTWFNRQLSRQSPRQEIIQRYQVFLQQSAQLGLRKGPSQTPTQFRKTLDRHLLLQMNPETVEITEMFIKARYSRKEIKKEDVQKLTPLLKRVLEKIKRLEK